MALCVSIVLLLIVMLFHTDEKKEYLALMAAETDEEIENVYIFQDKDTGTIYAVRECFTINGEYHENYECEFDCVAFELVVTDRSYVSDPVEDDFCWNSFSMAQQTIETSYQEELLGTTSSELVNESDKSIQLDSLEPSASYPQPRLNDDAFLDSELYKIASRKIQETIQEWWCLDFDGDGAPEAFVATGNATTFYHEDAVKSLWYISDTGSTICMINDGAYWYLGSIIIFDHGELLYLDARHGYNGIWGIRDNRPVQVNVEGSFYWVSQDKKTGIIKAADKREERAHVLSFDFEAMTLRDTGKTILND